MFDTVFWHAISGQVNRWRKKTLGLQSTSSDKMEQHKVPFFYNFSAAVVPPRTFIHYFYPPLLEVTFWRSTRLARVDSCNVRELASGLGRTNSQLYSGYWFLTLQMIPKLRSGNHQRLC